MIIIGVDEVGRGCLAGPVVASAVILASSTDAYDWPGLGLTDSKQLSSTRRQIIAAAVQTEAVAVGIGWVWPPQIDAHGLTAAVGYAMQQAVQQVVNRRNISLRSPAAVPYDVIIIDGNYNFLPMFAHVQTMVRADATEPAVSAASIVAKVARDNYMRTVAAKLYPEYGFERHVGYGTGLHRDSLRRHGLTPLHRRSFKPIKALL